MIKKLPLFFFMPLFSGQVFAAIDCSKLPEWADVYTTIQPGQQVQHVGSAYECKEFPYGGWCQQVAYEPGTTYGKEAWNFIDTCVDVSPPVVAITAPTVVAEVLPFTVTAAVTDPNGVGIAKVDFRLIDANGNLTEVASDTTAPFEAEYSGLAKGRYSINILATDAGQTESVPAEQPLIVIDDVEPAVVLDSPKDNANYTEGEDVKIFAYAATVNPEDSVRNVEFFSNGTSLFVDNIKPYEYTMPSIAAGKYSIQAVVNTTLNMSSSDTANITVAASTPSQDAFIPYWTSWGAANADVTALTNKTTILNMAFANMTDGFQVVASNELLQYSGTNTPQVVNYVEPEYMAWTTRKAQFPATKVLLSFGGASYSAQWNLLKTTINVPRYVNALGDVTSQLYPVYVKTGSYHYEKQGYVQLDGVDLDIESLGMEQDTTWSNNIASVIAQYGSNNPLKSITLTGMHTAADPASCQWGGSFDAGCSYPAGSSYAGSMTGVLQAIEDRNIKLNHYNVMAYDAGVQGVNYDWRVALSNLSQYLPKEKIVLGVTIGSQWGPAGNFTESMESIKAKAQEQKALGYGGVMSWAVGGGDPAAAPQDVQKMNEIADSFK